MAGTLHHLPAPIPLVGVRRLHSLRGSPGDVVSVLRAFSWCSCACLPSRAPFLESYTRPSEAVGHAEVSGRPLCYLGVRICPWGAPREAHLCYRLLTFHVTGIPAAGREAGSTPAARSVPELGSSPTAPPFVTLTRLFSVSRLRQQQPLC